MSLTHTHTDRLIKTLTSAIQGIRACWHSKLQLSLPLPVPTLIIPLHDLHIPLSFLPFNMQFFSYSPHSPLPIFQRLNQKLNPNYKRLEKNHRLLSIYFYFNFPLQFSRLKSFWPTLSLYSSLHFSLKTVKSSVSYLPPPPLAYNVFLY